MKLSTVALSTAVVLGVAVAGGSYYTGIYAENHYKAWVTTANQQLTSLKAIGVQAEIHNATLERHFFSSEIRYDLAIQADGIAETLQGQGTLYHGPFPLNRLSTGKLLPAMASLETNVTASGGLKSLFNAEKIINATVQMGYTQTVSGAIEVAGLKSPTSPTLPTSPLQFDGLYSEFERAKSGKGELHLKVPALTVRLDQQYKAEQAELKATFNQMAVEDFSLKAKSYVISPINALASHLNTELQNLSLSGKTELKGVQYALNTIFNSEVGLKNATSQYDLGKLNLALSANVDANEVSSFVQDKKRSNEMLVALFSKPFSVQISDLSAENEGGKSTLALALHSDGVSGAGNMMQFLNAFKQSKLETTLNIPSLEAFLRQSYSLSPVSTLRDNAKESAKRVTASMVYKAKAIGFTDVDEKNMRLTLEIDQGKVKLNGNDVPEKQVQGALFILMFGLSGLGR